MAQYRLFLSNSGGSSPTERARREALGAFGTYEPTLADVGALNDPAVVMETINGNVSLTADGAVLENKVVNGLVQMRGANQIVRNCIISGPATQPGLTNTALIWCDYAGTSNALIEDCTLEMQAPQYSYDGITGHDFTAKRVRIRYTTDGFGVLNSSGTAANVNIYGCWVDELARFNPDTGVAGSHTDGTHNDCIQMQNGTGIVVRGNVLRGFFGSNVGNTGGLNRQSPPYNTINACIQFNNNSGTTNNVVVDRNWFDGGEIGLNGGSLGAENTSITVTNNRFGRNQSLTTPGTNTTYTINIAAAVGLTVSGNTYTDGTAVQVRRP